MRLIHWKNPFLKLINKVFDLFFFGNLVVFDQNQRERWHWNCVSHFDGAKLLHCTPNLAILFLLNCWFRILLFCIKTGNLIWDGWRDYNKYLDGNTSVTFMYEWFHPFSLVFSMVPRSRTLLPGFLLLLNLVFFWEQAIYVLHPTFGLKTATFALQLFVDNVVLICLGPFIFFPLTNPIITGI